jgi:hypothetical protein
MKIRQAGTSTYLMYCPGCETLHSFGEGWGFNKDFTDKPDVQGSLLTGPTPTKPASCHLFIRDGKIEFLSDSTHSLSGTTVDLPEIPKDKYSFDEEE